MPLTVVPLLLTQYLTLAPEQVDGPGAQSLLFRQPLQVPGVPTHRSWPMIVPWVLVVCAQPAVVVHESAAHVPALDTHVALPVPQLLLVVHVLGIVVHVLVLVLQTPPVPQSELVLQPHTPLTHGMPLAHPPKRLHVLRAQLWVTPLHDQAGSPQLETLSQDAVEHVPVVPPVGQVDP